MHIILFLTFVHYNHNNNNNNKKPGARRPAGAPGLKSSVSDSRLPPTRKPLHEKVSIGGWLTSDQKTFT